MLHELKDPFRIHSVSCRTMMWNTVTVSALEIEPLPGKAWLDLSSDRSTLSIVTDQSGGTCEARLQLDSPTTKRPGMRHINYIPAGMTIWGYTDQILKARMTRLRFDFQTVAAALGEDLDSVKAEIPGLMFADPRISAIGDLLSAECARPDNLSPLYGESLITALFTDLLRLRKKPEPPSAHSPLAPWQLRRATEFMQEHLSASISLSDLAAISGLSQSRFGRAFKASTGVPPHKWLLDARIRRAQQLLLDGDLSLADVALSTGFAEQSHFTRAFRRVAGPTPGEWRRLHRDSR